MAVTVGANVIALLFMAGILWQFYTRLDDKIDSVKTASETAHGKIQDRLCNIEGDLKLVKHQLKIKDDNE